VGKGAAEVAYKRARTKVSHERIMSSLAVFARAQQGQDRNFTPHPSTWLNQGRWDDEPDDIAPPHINGQQQQSDDFMDDAMRRAQLRMVES
jgi:hypothetical protein